MQPDPLFEELARTICELMELLDLSAEHLPPHMRHIVRYCQRYEWEDA